MSEIWHYEDFTDDGELRCPDREEGYVTGHPSLVTCFWCRGQINPAMASVSICGRCDEPWDPNHSCAIEAR